MRELSLNVLDIAQNSIAAGAGLIRLEAIEDSAAETLELAVIDDGCGMDAETLARVQDPFYTTRTTRKVGLGVPFFKMACEMTGGRFSIDSAPGEGTEVRALFHTGHIDMVPLGEMGETVLLLIIGNSAIDFVYTRALDGGRFVLDTRELREALGGEVDFSEPEVTAWIREFLAENEAALRGQRAR